MSVINSFAGAHAFLSNFFPSYLTIDNLIYSSVEHAYQAFKMASPEHHERVRKAGTPGKAKILGSKFPKQADWDERKESIMLWLLRVKFNEPSMKRRLLATGDAELVEGNTWNDRYWGVCKGKGQNRLGILLMQVRDELRSADK